MKRFLLPILALLIGAGTVALFFLHREDAGRGAPARPVSEERAGMVFINGGSFSMGCSPGEGECAENEKPVHTVTISSFYLDATEVTQEAYLKFTGVNPGDFKGCPDCPVEQVTWRDARDYCAGLGKRLPTEAEFEYAARAGTTGPVRDNLESSAWYSNNSGAKAHPTAQKQPNAWGLYDMLGNVAEWTADWYGKNYYASSPAKDPKGPAFGFARVVRGGSWGASPRFPRVSYRDWDLPYFRFVNNLGFRCARDE